MKQIKFHPDRIRQIAIEGAKDDAAARAGRRSSCGSAIEYRRKHGGRRVNENSVRSSKVLHLIA
jgi:hypothetical protein